MKFFKPEDFGDWHLKFDFTQCELAARYANAKLEQEACLMYKEGSKWLHRDDNVTNPTHQALLIAIEPIEQCKHPLKRCAVWTSGTWDNITLKCPCGVYLKAATFEVVE